MMYIVLCARRAPPSVNLSSTKAECCSAALAEKGGGALGQDQSWFIKRVTREVCFLGSFQKAVMALQSKDLGFTIQLGFKSLLPGCMHLRELLQPCFLYL